MKICKLIFLPLIGILSLTACKGKKPQSKEWYEDESYIKSLTKENIGLEKEITVNNQTHKVRLIGVDHDDLVSGGKAHTTWEFANLLSDSDGYSLGVVWNWERGDESDNINFPNTNLRKALDGVGTSADFSWYQKGSATKSQYTSSAFSMLPIKLQSVLKEVKKPIAKTKEHIVGTYNTKLFTLSYSEMTLKSHPCAKNEGEIYEYYKNHDDNASRMKHQIKWYEGAATLPTTITDGKFESAQNWAGCNTTPPTKEDSDLGGLYWLRSPWINTSVDAFLPLPGGDISSNGNIYKMVCSVAPSFCI